MSSAASRSAQEKANLARIRDNQRRSRARRKEYLQELENRVRQCELQGIEASTEIQVAARRVSDENRKLRQLLNQSGIFDDMIEHHLATTAIPDSNTGGTGQAVALLDELLQPRKPAAGPGAATFMGLSVGTIGEYGRGISRDSSVGSMSTSQSSVWDQPMVPSSGHKRHRSAHSRNPSHSSTALIAGNQSGSGNPGTNHSNSMSPPINQIGGMLAPNQGQPQNMQIQSSASISPINTSIHSFPMYDPKTFDFDSQTNDSYESNNIYFQALPPQQQSSPNPQQNLQPQQQSQTQSHSRANSQNPSPVNNYGPDQESNFETTLMNTSSCIFAADMIGTMAGRSEEDVRAELGCGSGGEDCDVSDEVVFGVLERYS